MPKQKIKRGTIVRRYTSFLRMSRVNIGNQTLCSNGKNVREEMLLHFVGSEGGQIVRGLISSW